MNHVDGVWREARRAARRIRVVVVGQQTIFVDGLAARLQTFDFLQVDERLNDAASPLEFGEDPPDVIIAADGVSELFAEREVGTARSRRVPVLAVIDSAEPHAIARAFRHGADAFVTMTASADELVRAIVGLADGEVRLPVGLLGELLGAVVADATEQLELERRIASLTSRERQVLQLLLEGAAAPAIAGRLYVSANTVRSHIRAIFAKLEVRSHLELMRVARRFRKGLPEGGDESTTA